MQMPDVRYLRKLVDGVRVVAAPAEIDVTTAGQLRAVLLEATGAVHPMVVVDMTRTVFCDVSGLHTLLRAPKRAASEGGELRLVVSADRGSKTGGTPSHPGKKMRRLNRRSAGRPQCRIPMTPTPGRTCHG
jgi:anti-anti-sigma factor